MVRNGPLESRLRGGARRWPFGPRRANRRTRPAIRPAEVAALADASGRVSAIAPDAPTVRTHRVRDLLAAIAKGTAAAGLAAAAMAGAVQGHRWLTHSPKFAVREVRVSPTVHVRADDVRARAAVEPGANLFTIDLDAVAREVQGDPWLERVSVRRELPATVMIEVRERVPACAVAFGALYLADAQGQAWKRATPDEAAGLPVVTGIPRDAYIDDREAAQALVREALEALAVWREHADRPAIGEVHVDAADGITLYTAAGGVGVRIGRPDGAATWRERLARYDRVAASLQSSGEKAQLVLVDQRTRPERVTVKLATR